MPKSSQNHNAKIIDAKISNQAGKVASGVRRVRLMQCVTRMEDGGASACTRCGLKGLECEFSTVSESVPSERGSPSPLSSRSGTPSAPGRTVGQFKQPAAQLHPGALHLDSEVTTGRPIFQTKHIAHPHRHMLPNSALELGLPVPHLHFDNFSGRLEPESEPTLMCAVCFCISPKGSSAKY
ncbi:hypothetical protein C8R46DRAFT_1031674 [Mycena filopes]|nr:hypothetical protein C8R46DRAFT_1031674 [Mycena filopes]